jgi:type IV fimbrial biogenesis protein FimT
MKPVLPKTGLPLRRLSMRGFTLIELMVVVALAAILAVIATPSFRELMVSTRTRAAASALHESLWLARSEAIKRNKPVTFTVTTLQDGWTITPVDKPATVLRKQDGLPDLKLSFNSGTSVTFEYNSQGRLTDGVAAVKMTLSGADGLGPRCISFDAAARPKLTSGACA